MQKIVPLHDQILVEPIVEKVESAGGIVIPESGQHNDKPMRGKVIAVGPGKLDQAGKRMPVDVKVGDEILFTKYSPNEIKIEGTLYLVLEEKSVLAKITK
ncbi:MAG: co-chaperone GroES [Patescibacteria group bacterium]|nr:co-chaperone GroES [Patescibacteria group bacterium]